MFAEISGTHVVKEAFLKKILLEDIMLSEVSQNKMDRCRNDLSPRWDFKIYRQVIINSKGNISGVKDGGWILWRKGVGKLVMGGVVLQYVHSKTLSMVLDTNNLK